MSNALIIFVKNPIPGKVKTRLAKTIGEDKAVSIYKRLLQHTAKVTKPVEVDKYVFYGDYINHEDLWDEHVYKKYLQQGEDLGERMLNAFSQVYEQEHEKVLIVGSDCLELNVNIINEGFQKLYETDVVIGPAEDGGYYLLGLKSLHTDIFKDIEWSTGNVLSRTIEILTAKGIEYSLLPTLSDVDEEKDLPESWL